MPVIRFAGGPRHGKTQQVEGEPDFYRVRVPGDDPVWAIPPDGPPRPLRIETIEYRRTPATTPEGHRWYVAPGHTRSLIEDGAIAAAAWWLAERVVEAGPYTADPERLVIEFAMRYETHLLRSRATATPESPIGLTATSPRARCCWRVVAAPDGSYCDPEDNRLRPERLVIWPPPSARAYRPSDHPGSEVPRLLSVLSERPDDRDLRMIASDAFEEVGRVEEAELLRSDAPVVVCDGRVDRRLLTVDHTRALVARLDIAACTQHIRSIMADLERNYPELGRPAGPALSGSITVGVPCHHPAWPMRCDRCGHRADGFYVTQYLGNGHAYDLTGMACMSCRRVVLREPQEPAPTGVDLLAMEYAVWSDGLFRGTTIARLAWDRFDADCRMVEETASGA